MGAVAVILVALGIGIVVVVSRDSSSKRSAQARSDAALLRVEDLPAGFSTSSISSSSSDSTDPAKTNANKCLTDATGLSSDAADADRAAKSQAKFESGSGASKVSVQAEVEVYNKTDEALRVLHALSDPSIGPCIQRLFSDTFSKQGIAVSDYQQIPVDLPNVGDDRGGFRSTFTIMGNTGRTATVSFVTAVVEKADAFVSMVITATNGSEPPTLLGDGLSAMAGRIT